MNENSGKIQLRLMQAIMEQTYSRHQIHQVVMNDLRGSQFNLMAVEGALLGYVLKSYYKSKQNRIEHLVSNHDLKDIIYELLCIVSQKPEAVPIQTIVTPLANYLGYKSQWDGIKTAAEIVAIAGKNDLLDIISAGDSETGSIQVERRYQLDNITQQKLDKMKYLPPMLCKPESIVNNKTSGYLTKDDSVILGGLNHHDECQSLDVINIQNSIKLSLDLNIVKLKEEPKKVLDTQDKITDFNRMAQSSKVVYQEMIDSGNEFYLCHKNDKRGRLYAQGYHISYQGTSYKKAIVNLAKKELIV
jgi:hypothetical protein